MSITLSPEELTPAVRLKDFSFTVGVSAGDSVDEITVSLIGESEPITITTTDSSFSASGKYITGFTDTLTYVNQGSSNLTETPTSVVGIQNMPTDKALFDLAQDQKQSLFRTYSITVKYTEDFESKTETIQLQHEVANDLESIRSFMATYY